MATTADLRIGETFVTANCLDIFEAIGRSNGAVAARRLRDGEVKSFPPTTPVTKHDSGESSLLGYCRARVRASIQCDMCTEKDEVTLGLRDDFSVADYERQAAGAFHVRGWRALPREDVVLCPAHAVGAD